MIMAVKETLYYAHYSEHLMHLTIGTQCFKAVYISARGVNRQFFLLDVKSQKFFIFFFLVGVLQLSFSYQWKSIYLLIIKISLKPKSILKISFYKLIFKILTKSVIRRFRHVTWGLFTFLPFLMESTKSAFQNDLFLFLIWGI